MLWGAPTLGDQLGAPASMTAARHLGAGGCAVSAAWIWPVPRRPLVSMIGALGGTCAHASLRQHFPGSSAEVGVEGGGQAGSL